jgi:subfamily B ATP-binding cassette protein MsbA
MPRSDFYSSDPDQQKRFERVQPKLGGPEALRRLWGYRKYVMGPVIAGFIFTLLWSTMNLSYAKLIHGFLDTIKQDAGTHNYRNLQWWVAGAFLLYPTRALVYFGMHYAWSSAGQKLAMKLRNDIFAHLQKMSLSFFDHRKTGYLISSVDNDVAVVTQIMDAIQDMIDAPFILIFGGIALFWLNPWLAALSVVVLLPAVFVIQQANQRIRRRTDEMQAGRAQVVDHVQEKISGIRVVKAFGNEDHEIDLFLKKSEGVRRGVLKNARIKFIARPTVEMLGAFAIVFVAWNAGSQIVHDAKAFDIPKLITFCFLLQQVADAGRNLGNISVNATVASVAADRIFTLLDTKSEIVEKPDAVELGEVKGRVTFDNVEFAYSSGIPVLTDLTFTMEPGEVVALVGPTGAGKTTVASLIPRFYEVAGGAVRIDGIDVRDCTVKSLRRQVGIVPQETILFAGTLRENIAYGRLDATEEEIVEAAKMSNAWEFIERMPHGLDTRVGERGNRLSGGQRQRIAIARAILRNPRILILDEATSSLDARSEALVQDALKRLVKHRTTLVIAHRLSTIQNADKILLIKDGRVEEEGRHEELLARGGVYSQLYNTQYGWREEAVEPLEEDVVRAAGV